jgi:hypothetical protein
MYMTSSANSDADRGHDHQRWFLLGLRHHTDRFTAAERTFDKPAVLLPILWADFVCELISFH